MKPQYGSGLLKTTAWCLREHVADNRNLASEGNDKIYSDISTTYDRKISALRCHKSQMKAFTSSDPFGWLKNRCREMAQGESYEPAEGFHRIELPQ
jgi:LmbE family N-acetylglucosaminyl deacetylase